MKATLFFDGACEGNPGPMAIAYVLDGPDGKLAELGLRLEERGTSNIAEYQAIIRGLEKAKELGVKDIQIRGDSNLVVQQLLGKFRVRQPHLRPLHQRVADLANGFGTVDVKWIPREENKRADALAYTALTGKSSRAAMNPADAPRREPLGSTPGTREHDVLCPKCRKPCTLAIQTFKDGSEHIRKECPEHGFIGYAPNVEPFLTLARKSKAP